MVDLPLSASNLAGPCGRTHREARLAAGQNAPCHSPSFARFHYDRNAEDGFRSMRIVKLVLRLLILPGGHLSKDQYHSRLRRLAVLRPLARSL